MRESRPLRVFLTQFFHSNLQVIVTVFHWVRCPLPRTARVTLVYLTDEQWSPPSKQLDFTRRKHFEDVHVVVCHTTTQTTH